MERVQVMDVNGKKITLLDFSGCPRNEIEPTITQSKQVIKSHSPNSALTLTDVTNMSFNTEVITAFKEFTEHNKPYVKAAAVIGVTGLVKIAYEAVSKFSKRNLQIFSNREEATQWLSKQ